MSERFNLEIISPDKTLIKSEVNEVIIPAFEGYMTILKDHISLVTFLRPGFIEVKKENNKEKFYIEEGTVEFFKNNLLILSSTIKNRKDFLAEDASKMLEETQKKIKNASIKDKESYILSYKIETLKEIIH
jgi:F-type H+-transporting ATPase subunit epsilon|tara:strand:+ start:1002 stop:1394 length:393 start_codon:yes stop_codon:yes gene_type:complete